MGRKGSRYSAGGCEREGVDDEAMGREEEGVEGRPLGAEVEGVEGVEGAGVEVVFVRVGVEVEGVPLMEVMAVMVAGAVELEARGCGDSVERNSSRNMILRAREVEVSARARE